VSGNKPPHPLAYLLMIIPFGAISGFTSVALAFTGTKHGVSSEDAALIIGFGMAPQVVKFLWAPLCDMTLDRRRWYLLSALACIVGVVLMGAIPLRISNETPDLLPANTVPLMKAVVLVTSLATSTLAMAVEGVVAHLTPAEDRGRVAGWMQSGNLGGGAVGGGVALWLMENAPFEWMGGAAVAVVFAFCALPVFLLPVVPADRVDGGVGQALVALLRMLWDMLRSRQGLFAAILCFAPISTGAAGGVLAQSTVAAHWGATADDVITVNGLAAGFCMTFGCFVGGQLCAWARPRTVYALVGFSMAVVAALLAFAPPTRAVFIVGVLVYQFGTGVAYASWTGFILDAIGTGAAATKYNIFASLSNTPITYMGVLLGYAVTPYGADGMLLVEASAGIVGTVVVLSAARVLLGGAQPPETAPA
jgi:PAT family beta-lactamase induction signal transducer AmpG